MLKILPITTIFLLTAVFFIPTSSLAVPIANNTTVTQNNDCFDCGNLEQINVTVITQDIFLGALWLIPENRDTLSAFLSNIARVGQDNVCSECIEVSQKNIARIVQNILDLTITIPLNSSLPISQIPPSLFTNLAEVEQDNSCKECLFDDQTRFELITQEITVPNNLLTLTPVSLLGNFARISQTNSCIVCDGVFQGNLAIVVQNLSPIATPEPGTLILLGSGLIGLGFFQFAKRRL